MKMRKFKVNPDLREYLENVLKRNGIQYTFNEDDTVSAPISGELFHKFVIRARCEKTDFEKEGLVTTMPHIHVSELNKRLMAERVTYDDKMVFFTEYYSLFKEKLDKLLTDNGYNTVSDFLNMESEDDTTKLYKEYISQLLQM